MKAILEFNMEDDKHDFELAVNASKWYILAWEFDQYLRTRMKYEENISEDEYKAVEAAREKLRDLMYESSLNFD